MEILDKTGTIGKSLPIDTVDFMDSGLANRIVLVTGASGGIGAGLVHAFASEGARVIAHYASHPEPALQMEKALGSTRCRALRADLTKESDVEQLFHGTETAFGPVEVLIVNAGIWPAEDVPIADMTLDRWRRTLDIDLTSAFLCLREFFRGIRRSRLQDPAAILIGSTAGIFGEAGHADYAAAKAAMIYGLARSLKNEIARIALRGRINVVCPGWVLTPMTRESLANDRLVRRTLQTVPLRKIAAISDITPAVVYLASNRLAGHVTGQVLTVAGGMEGRVLYEPEEINVPKG